MNKSKKQKHWFKRRRYGFGWTPITWQGWLSILIFLAVVMIGSYIIEDTPRNTLSPEAILYLVFFAFATLMLIIVSVKKGPSPKWRWGIKATDNPDEDI